MTPRKIALAFFGPALTLHLRGYTLLVFLCVWTFVVLPLEITLVTAIPDSWGIGGFLLGLASIALLTCAFLWTLVAAGACDGQKRSDRPSGPASPKDRRS